jgi:hypothetical protein
VNDSVSGHLDQEHGLKIRPDGKGTCPFCRRNTFSVRKDDSIGKCFHPACGKFITVASLGGDYQHSLYQVLDKLKVDFHAHLLAQENVKSSNAWAFLVGPRRIDPAVIRDLPELGAVPRGYDVAAAFKPAFDALDARERELQAKIEESLNRRLEAKEQRAADHKDGKQKAKPTAKGKTEWEKKLEAALEDTRWQRRGLEDNLAVLKERLSDATEWMAFSFTDQHHRVLSVQFRKPFEKKFSCFKPSESLGVFGHSLFRPYVSEDKQQLNRLVLVEGPFNLLQIHSCVVRAGAAACHSSPEAQANGKPRDPAYANWIGAVGSSSAPDARTVLKMLEAPGAEPVPLVIQDHDEAGDGMVEKLLEHLAIELTRPPAAGSDVDDFLRGFGDDHRRALEELRRLVQAAERRCRSFRSVAAQIYGTRQKKGKEDERREFEISAAVAAVLTADLRTRGKFYHEFQQGYYFHDETKRLIALDDHDRALTCLLANYGMNGTERLHEYLVEHLQVEAVTNGEAVRVHRFTWYNRATGTLYVYNHAAGIHRLTADTMELVDNGTDGVLFLHDPANEPFELVTEENLGDPFHESVTAQVNFETEGQLSLQDQQALFTCWFQSVFFGPLFPTRPILAFIGPKGSGKSFTLRKVGLLLFGPKFEVASLPSKEDAFDSVVTNTYFAAFDNADSKVAWLPDRLAVCATGGAVPKRVLFTTNQLADYRIDCFLGITSRTPYFQRDDVADRLLVFHVRRFGAEEGGGEGGFVAEEALKAEILTNRNRIITAVLRELQNVLAYLNKTEGRTYRTDFRMADFGTFVLRMADARGKLQKAEELLARMGCEQDLFTMEGDSLVELLGRWLEDAKNHGRAVDAGTLHGELVKLAEEKRLKFGYTSGRSLGQRLRNVLPNLRSVYRVELDSDTHRKQKAYRFWPLEGQVAGMAGKAKTDSASDSADVTVGGAAT